MIAIKYFPNTEHYIVCDGVWEDVKVSEDGTFTGSAGITAHPVSRRFYNLEEAQEAKRAFEEYARKYK